MKINLITIGKPKLAYAGAGFDEYFKRLSRLHSVRHTAIADKYAYSEVEILRAAQGTTICVLDIPGKMYSSQELADFLAKREIEAREVSFVIGGPEGLPEEVRTAANYKWSLSNLTLPHDLAMVTTLEALYRASTINAGLPYHK